MWTFLQEKTPSGNEGQAGRLLFLTVVNFCGFVSCGELILFIESGENRLTAAQISRQFAWRININRVSTSACSTPGAPTGELSVKARKLIINPST
jgi:hypothetical protein